MTPTVELKNTAVVFVSAKTRQTIRISSAVIIKNPTARRRLTLRLSGPQGSITLAFPFREGLALLQWAYDQSIESNGGSL